MEDKLQELKRRLLEINDLQSAAAVLGWDQRTYMPPGGGLARGRQLATLRRLAQEKFADVAVGRLLEDLRPLEESLPAESVDASLIRVTRRDYEKAIKVPAEYWARVSAHAAASYQAWTTARADDDFAAVEPFLEQTLALSRELADYFPGYEHIADPLIDYSDQGMRASTIRSLFADLRAGLVPLLQAIMARPEVDDSCIRRRFDEQRQSDFALDVARRFGFDLERGRLDKTTHPFATRFAGGDVRITTRYEPELLNAPLFPTLHEAGHAMYEQGTAPDLDGTPLGRGTSSGVHESQSRLWENLVGRSLDFWRWAYPRLQSVFPEQLASVSLDMFYRAINKVQPSPIRVKADEVTYNLHVMLRFDFELDLLEGRLAVRDLAEAWRARVKTDLGLDLPDDRQGVLQDVHWYSGRIGGGFQGYTLGNILSAQFWARALEDRPSIPDEIAAGEFGTLHGWLQEHIYRHGRIYTPSELVERSTGEPLRIDPYLHYLHTKYGELYGL